MFFHVREFHTLTTFAAIAPPHHLTPFGGFSLCGSLTPIAPPLAVSLYGFFLWLCVALILSHPHTSPPHTLWRFCVALCGCGCGSVCGDHSLTPIATPHPHISTAKAFAVEIKPRQCGGGAQSFTQATKLVAGLQFI